MLRSSKALAHLLGIHSNITTITNPQPQQEKENSAKMINSEGRTSSHTTASTTATATSTVGMDVDDDLNQFGFPYQNGEISPYFEFIKGQRSFFLLFFLSFSFLVNSPSVCLVTFAQGHCITPLWSMSWRTQRRSGTFAWMTSYCTNGLPVTLGLSTLG